MASKVAALGDAAKAGIVAASAGNHAQAVAFRISTRRVEVPCHIFMPRDAPIAKVSATESYGATVASDRRCPRVPRARSPAASR